MERVQPCSPSFADVERSLLNQNGQKLCCNLHQQSRQRDSVVWKTTAAPFSNLNDTITDSVKEQEKTEKSPQYSKRIHVNSTKGWEIFVSFLMDPGPPFQWPIELFIFFMLRHRSGQTSRNNEKNLFCRSAGWQKIVLDHSLLSAFRSFCQLEIYSTVPLFDLRTHEIASSMCSKTLSNKWNNYNHNWEISCRET